jgi:hypothetical protein
MQWYYLVSYPIQFLLSIVQVFHKPPTFDSRKGHAQKSETKQLGNSFGGCELV